MLNLKNCFESSGYILASISTLLGHRNFFIGLRGCPNLWAWNCDLTRFKAYKTLCLNETIIFHHSKQVLSLSDLAHGCSGWIQLANGPNLRLGLHTQNGKKKKDPEYKFKTVQMNVFSSE